MRVVSPDSQSGPERNPRARRLVVFCCVFFAALALGLTYTAMQPAEYRATARLEIIPAKAVPATGDNTAGAATGADTRGPVERGSKSFLTEVQVLTSRPREGERPMRIYFVALTVAALTREPPDAPGITRSTTRAVL